MSFYSLASILYTTRVANDPRVRLQGSLSVFYLHERGLWSSSFSTYLRSQIDKTQRKFGGAKNETVE